MTCYSFTKRAIDIVAVVAAAPLVLPLALMLAVLIRATSPGPALYWSQRQGAGGVAFHMPKFRSMRVGTPVMATHLLSDARSALTPIGGFLRTSSLDEIPQLWSVLTGDMTLVGPRPALVNQDDLIALRQAAGVSALVPGITGLAQVSGRDALSIPEKVALDRKYLQHRSLALDLRILARTAWKILAREGITH